MNQRKYSIPQVESGMYLAPSEKISEEFLKKLQVINDRYTKNKDFPAYKKALGEFLQVSEPQMNDSVKHFIAGFIEGEGSVNVGAKKGQSTRLKLMLDPEFSVTQHVNGISILYLILCYFKTGRIRHKRGSNATFVYVIDNRDSLKQKVVPFYDNYLKYINSPVKKRRVLMFKTLLKLFEERAHLDGDRMIHELLPLWDAMRMQVGAKNQSFANLEEAQQYVRDAMRKS